MALAGEVLLSRLYVNELLEGLLVEHDPLPEIYVLYQQVLQYLANASYPLDTTLRGFEIQLLESLGYGFDWHACADNDQPIVADGWYASVAEQGYVVAGSISGQHLVFPGTHVQAISQGECWGLQVQRTVKQLLRVALNPLLSGKPIRSRELVG